MGILNNTIVLDDQASKTLQAVKEEVLELIETFKLLNSEGMEGVDDDLKGIKAEIAETRQETEKIRQETEIWNSLAAEGKAEQQAIKTATEATKKEQAELRLEIAKTNEEKKALRELQKESDRQERKERQAIRDAQREADREERKEKQAIKEEQQNINREKKEAAALTKTVKEETTGWKNILEKVKPLLAGAAGILSISGILGYIKGGIDSANEEIRIRTQLHRQIERQASSLEEAARHHEHMVELAGQLQSQTSIGASNWLAGVTSLSRFTKELGSAEILMQGIGDLSVAVAGTINVSADKMEYIAQAVGRGLKGQTRYLERMGVQFSELEKHAIEFGNEIERSTAIASAIDRSFGGLAETMMQTPEGMRQALGNVLGDIQQSIGDVANTFKSSAIFAILPLIEKIPPLVERATSFIKDNISSIMPTLAVLGIVALAVGAKFAIAWAIAMAPVLKIIAAIVLLQRILSRLGISFGDILGTAIGVFMGIWNVVKTIFMSVWQVVQGVIRGISGLFERLSGKGNEQFGFLKELIKGHFMAILDNVLNVVAFIINGFIDMANFIGGVFKDPIGAVVDLFRNMVDRILSLLQPLADSIVRVVNLIPGVNVENPLTGLRQRMNAAADQFLEGRGYERMFERLDPVEMRNNIIGAFERGNQIGRDTADRFESAFDKFGDIDSLVTGGFGGIGDFGDVGGEMSDVFDSYGTSSPGGSALRVAQQGAVEIKGDMIRLMENVYQGIYSRGAYQQRPNLTVNVGGIHETVNANQLSDAQRESIAARAGQYSADIVAEAINEAYGNNLRSAYA